MVSELDKKWNEAVLKNARDGDDLCSVDPETGKITILPMRASQEIRARALECAVGYGANPQDWMNFWDLVAKFEDYIRNGNVR